MNLIYFTLIFSFAWLCQPTLALRIKRADKQDDATNQLKQNSEQTANTLTVGTAAAAATDQPDVKITNVSESAVVKAAAAAAGAAAASGAAPVETKPELLENALNLDALGRLHHAKRRMALIDDTFLPRMGHRAHQHVSNAAPPYVYFNKMISPDGKQELKEFQLLAPNVVIESMQHDVNYGPGQEMGGVLLLNAESNGNVRGPAKPLVKHHQKHKAGLPPFLYLLQQMLQPNLNLELEAQNQRNHMDLPLYQFLDSAVDNALHNNRESIEHILGEQEQRDELNDIKDTNKDKELAELQSQKLEDAKEDAKDDAKSKEANELMTNRKDDELIVSCPIHHEHHANNNGDVMDDDVVLVNECHIV